MLAAIMSTSCTDFLDLPPKNQRAVENYDDVKSVFVGYLNYISAPHMPYNWGPDQVILPPVAQEFFEAYSDNIDFTKAMASGVYLHAKNSAVPYGSDLEEYYSNHLLFNEYSVPKVLWKSYYETVGRINSLVDVLNGTSEGSQEQRDQLLGEMLVHRAFYLYKLFQYFAPYTNGELGIPIYLHTGEEVVGVKMPRKTHAEAFAIILDDLNSAKEMLERSGSDQGFNLWFTDHRLNNLLAQVYWYKAESPAKEDTDYVNAKDCAEAAIEGIASNIPTNTYDLQQNLNGNYSDYPGFYQYSKWQGYADGIHAHQWANFGNYYPKDIALSSDVSTIFSSDDIRYAAMIHPSDSTLLNNAWPDGTTNTMKRGNILLFQPEEAYLILAEANFRLGAEGECISVLNEFKSFRNSGSADGLTGEELFQEVLNERRKEFMCMRDIRWIDLKRYANTSQTRTIMVYEKEYSVTVEPNGYQYALPIPLDELSENPNLQQNEGWVMIDYSSL